MYNSGEPKTLNSYIEKMPFTLIITISIYSVSRELLRGEETRLKIVWVIMMKFSIDRENIEVGERIIQIMS